MNIVNIFAYKLFAFHYEGEVDNEYDRLINLWTDTEYVREFLCNNEQDIPSHKTKRDYINYIREDAIQIDKQLDTITKSTEQSLSHFFKPLDNEEFECKILSLQKGRQYCLRIYAIKIDEDTYVITGGAIKLPLHHLMRDREHTALELRKINRAKDYIKAQDIVDEESFFEFLNENCHD